MSDLQAAMNEGFEAVKSYLDKSLSGFEKRLVAIEGRPIPVAEPGKPGEPGKSVTAEDMRPMIFQTVAEVVKELPKPADLVSILNASIDRKGHLILTLSNGSEKDVGLVIGKDGDPGKDGEHGFSLEDFSAEVSEDCKTITLKFERGEIKKTSDLIFPTVVYREIWKEGTFEKGDAVTYGGSLWIARKETTGKPGESNDWRLAVKKGRDGKKE